ncbi:hypothetical protein NHG29_01600 [Aerococcaceae bacterium NML160702]|nr:hypothetical protein [Aerococcaceae bacterium NML160702]
MNKKDLQAYLNTHAPSIIRQFSEKALDFQQEKNKARGVSKRWSEKKVQESADKMLEQFIEAIHAKVASTLSPNSRKSEIAWRQKIEEIELIDNLADMIGELEFE